MEGECWGVKNFFDRKFVQFSRNLFENKYQKSDWNFSSTKNIDNLVEKFLNILLVPPNPLILELISKIKMGLDKIIFINLFLTIFFDFIKSIFINYISTKFHLIFQIIFFFRPKAKPKNHQNHVVTILDACNFQHNNASWHKLQCWT